MEYRRGEEKRVASKAKLSRARAGLVTVSAVLSACPLASVTGRWGEGTAIQRASEANRLQARDNEVLLRMLQPSTSATGPADIWWRQTCRRPFTRVPAVLLPTDKRRQA